MKNDAPQQLFTIRTVSIETPAFRTDNIVMTTRAVVNFKEKNIVGTRYTGTRTCIRLGEEFKKKYFFFRAIANKINKKNRIAECAP